jgi:tetratricopeptide (TPR) repeat protein
MKTCTSVLILLTIWIAIGARAQTERGGPSHPSAAPEHRFSSDLGFDLSYPAEWTTIDLGPTLPVAKMDLDKQSESDPYRRGIECAQTIFSARLGEPRSIFQAGAVTTECMGGKPDLDAFTTRTMKSLGGRYQLSETKYAAFAVEGQTFWAMRTSAVDLRDATDVQTIEYLATVLPAGLVYWSAHSLNEQARSGFEHAHLHLTGGVETELIPAGVFSGKASPQQEFTSLGTAAAFISRVPTLAHASHHFVSGLGFNFEIPSNLTIFDPQQWEEATRRDASGQIVPSNTPPSHRRRTLLMTESDDSFKRLLLTSCTRECLGSPISIPDLSLIMASDVLDLARKFTLSKPEYGSFSAGAHRFSVMRASATELKRPWEAPKYLTLVITPVEGGVAEFFLQGRTRADLDALLASRLRFEDGAETELTPAEAFSLKRQAAPEFTKSAPEEPAQTAAPAAILPNPPAVPLDYSGEPVVIEQLDHLYTVAADGTGVRQFTLAARVQSDAAVRQYGVLSLSYAASSEHIELVYVRVRRPDGSLTETPLDTAVDMPSPVTTAAPFYSDLKELQIPVRNLRVGDRLEWQARIVCTKAEIPGQFWGEDSFVSDNVVLSQSLELRVPKGLDVNVWSPANKPLETTTPSEHIYRWRDAQLKPTVGPQAEAEKERAKKRVWTSEEETEEKEGAFPTIAWTTFKNWDEIGAWYRGLEKDRTLPADAEVRSKVAELTAGKATEEEKVRALYAYVSTQIRYIGVAFGIGRYQPHRAVEVLLNQYGDCKDKHTLLAAMLEVLGLRPEAVLIGAGIRFNQAVPSPRSFNHLITRVVVEGKPVWLDSTAEVAPYRVLNPSLRDRNALVISTSGPARIERTPAAWPFPAVQTMDAAGVLDATGTSNAHIVLTLRGDNEIQARDAFHQASPAQYDQIVQQLSYSMGYSGVISHATVSRPEDTTGPLRIAYDYRREKAGDWEHLRIVPQVAPVDLPRVDAKEPPVHFIDLGQPRTMISTSSMKIPAGWGATLPAAVHVESPWATYAESYRFENGTVFAERKIEVLQDRIPQADWKSYKKFADDADLGNELFIQLTPFGSVSTANPLGTPEKQAVAPAAVEAPVIILHSLGDPQGAKLIAAARLSIQHRDFESAQSQLDQAHSLNPQQMNLWTNYGYLEFQRGNMTAAVADYQKELALYPDHFGTYSSLAEAQNILGLEKEAQQTLRNWAAAQPDSAAPVSALVLMLLDENHPVEAVSAADAGLTRLSAMNHFDQHLQLLTGEAQLAAGDLQKGLTTLRALIRTTTDLYAMNDAAYQLAKAGLDLSLAESTAQAALDGLTAESKSWTLQTNIQNELVKSRHIASTWDTIGWILYRQGKIAAAESYIRPAWINRESAEIGEHLAEIAQIKGDPDEALRLWELAQATFPNYLRPSVRKTPGATQKELTEHIEALRKAGVKEPAGDPDETLRQLSTVPLGPSDGRTGSAECRLLLSHGEVLDLQQTGENELPIARERILSAKLPAFWPKGSDARLVRNAMIHCRAGVCELVFEP